MMKRSKWRQIRLPIAETMKWIMGSWLFSEISIRNSSETGAGPLLYQSLTCSMWRSSVWQVGRHGDAQVTERQVAIRLSLPSIIKNDGVRTVKFVSKTRVYGFTSRCSDYAHFWLTFVVLFFHPQRHRSGGLRGVLLNIHSSNIGILSLSSDRYRCGKYALVAT